MIRKRSYLIALIAHCDLCGVEYSHVFSGELSTEAFKHEIKKEKWTILEDKTFCPEHAPERIQIPSKS